MRYNFHIYTHPEAAIPTLKPTQLAIEQDFSPERVICLMLKEGVVAIAQNEGIPGIIVVNPKYITYIRYEQASS